MTGKLYNVGVYIRLSVENTFTGSESIENQREMLLKFIAHMPCWVERRVYIDNGASGGNFNRQGFQDMMTDVRNKEINLVLVQDLSRFGRNYLEAGKYLEDELPSLGCRFVSLMDGIDTETGENDIMPLLSVGDWTRPTDNVAPYKQENSLVAFMPTSQSACERQRAAR